MQSHLHSSENQILSPKNLAQICIKCDSVEVQTDQDTWWIKRKAENTVNGQILWKLAVSKSFFNLKTVMNENICSSMVVNLEIFIQRLLPYSTSLYGVKQFSQ